jgi:fibronectin type 3 domain-containing protein
MGWYIDDVSVDNLQTCGQGFPGIPTLISPTNAANSIPYSQPVSLQWKQAANTNTYRVFWGTDPNALNELLETTGLSASIPSASLRSSTTYCWRVVAVNDQAQSPSAVWSFKTQNPPPPTAPMLRSPSNLSRSQNFTLSTPLSWNPVENAQNYQVYWDTNPTPATLLAETTGTTIQTPSILVKAGVKYYWRVVAVNNYGSTSSDTWIYQAPMVDPDRIALYLVGNGSALSADEQQAVDYNNNGKVEIDDLIMAIKQSQ